MSAISRIRRLMQDGKPRTVRQIREALPGLDPTTAAWAAFTLHWRHRVLDRAEVVGRRGSKCYQYKWMGQ